MRAKYWYIVGLVVVASLMVLTGIMVSAQIMLKNDERVITRMIENLLDQAEEIINPVAGSWQEYDDLGWTFIPDDGKPYSYWADHHDKRKFFTLLDLDLYQADGQALVRPFQYHKAYSFKPIPLSQPELVRIDSFQMPEGNIWIEKKTPGMLRLMGETKAHLLLDTTIIWAEISIPDLNAMYNKNYSSGGFYWEPEIEAKISDVRKTSTVR